jgi:hypothetical protein
LLCQETKKMLHLPPQTHSFDKSIMPAMLAQYCIQSLNPKNPRGG